MILRVPGQAWKHWKCTEGVGSVPRASQSPGCLLEAAEPGRWLQGSVLTAAGQWGGRDCVKWAGTTHRAHAGATAAGAGHRQRRPRGSGGRGVAEGREACSPTKLTSCPHVPGCVAFLRWDRVGDNETILYPNICVKTQEIREKLTKSTKP